MNLVRSRFAGSNCITWASILLLWVTQACKIPVLCRWVDSYDIGPTRHLLPLLVLYVIELIQFERHEAASPLWENMLVALLSALFVGVFWRGVLRMFSEEVPGAVNWLDLRDAGVGVSAHDRDRGRS